MFLPHDAARSVTRSKISIDRTVPNLENTEQLIVPFQNDGGIKASGFKKASKLQILYFSSHPQFRNEMDHQTFDG